MKNIPPSIHISEKATAKRCLHNGFSWLFCNTWPLHCNWNFLLYHWSAYMCSHAQPSNQRAAWCQYSKNQMWTKSSLPRKKKTVKWLIKEAVKEIAWCVMTRWEGARRRVVTRGKKWSPLFNAECSPTSGWQSLERMRAMQRTERQGAGAEGPTRGLTLARPHGQEWKRKKLLEECYLHW